MHKFLWFWMGLIALALGVFYMPKLMSYQLSGDDLLLVDAAPRSLQDIFMKLSDFSYQYRPLTHTLFAVHRWLLPNTTAIWTIHYILLFAVVFLLFKNLGRFLNPLPATILTTAVFLSPIFYYHFFSISALNNLLMSIWLLLSLLLLDFPQAKGLRLGSKQKIMLGFLLLILSILTKESFLVNAFVFYVLMSQNMSSKTMPLGFLVTTLLIATYLFLHFFFYAAPQESDYQLNASIQGLLHTSLDMFSWLIAYPRGWQYGAPEPKTFMTYLTTLITLLGLGSIMVPLAPVIKAWKSQLIFFVALGLSIAPFLVVDRALVFYLDISLFVLVFWFVYNHTYIHKHMRTQQNSIYGIFILSFVLQYATYHRQWHQYSFVANANEVMYNYERVLMENNYQAYDQICLINNSRGAWATKEGDAARMLFGFAGSIISTDENILPPACLQKNTLILENDGWQFKNKLNAGH